MTSHCSDCLLCLNSWEFFENFSINELYKTNSILRLWLGRAFQNQQGRQSRIRFWNKYCSLGPMLLGFRSQHFVCWISYQNNRKMPEKDPKNRSRINYLKQHLCIWNLFSSFEQTDIVITCLTELVNQWITGQLNL